MSKKLNKIKALLGMETEIKLAFESTLTDGTVIGTDAEEWEVGVLAYVITEDDAKMPLPTGESEEDTDEEVEEDVEEEKEEVVEEEEEVVEEEEVEAQAVSKADLIKVISQMNKDFDQKIDKLSKELKSSMKKFSATKPLGRGGNQPTKVEIQKPMSEMSISERTNSIFNKINNN